MFLEEVSIKESFIWDLQNLPHRSESDRKLPHIRLVPLVALENHPEPPAMCQVYNPDLPCFALQAMSWFVFFFLAYYIITERRTRPPGFLIPLVMLRR